MYHDSISAFIFSNSSDKALGPKVRRDFTLAANGMNVVVPCVSVHLIDARISKTGGIRG